MFDIDESLIGLQKVYKESLTERFPSGMTREQYDEEFKDVEETTQRMRTRLQRSLVSVLKEEILKSVADEIISSVKSDPENDVEGVVEKILEKYKIQSSEI